jgi:hypothetical protein
MDTYFDCPKCKEKNSFSLGRFCKDFQPALAKQLLSDEGVILDCCKCHAVILLKIEGRLNAASA